MKRQYDEENCVSTVSVLLDLPRQIDRSVLVSIGEFMPLAVFFDGILSHIYNSDLHILLESVDLASEGRNSDDVGKYTSIINDNVMTITAALKKELGLVCGESIVSDGLFISPDYVWLVSDVDYKVDGDVLSATIKCYPTIDQDIVSEAADELIGEDDDEDDDENSEDQDEMESD